MGDVLDVEALRKEPECVLIALEVAFTASCSPVWIVCTCRRNGEPVIQIEGTTCRLLNPASDHHCGYFEHCQVRALSTNQCLAFQR